MTSTCFANIFVLVSNRPATACRHCNVQENAERLSFSAAWTWQAISPSGIRQRAWNSRDSAALARSASCIDRKSVVYGKSVSVRLDLGGRRFIKKNKFIDQAHNKRHTLQTDMK